MEVLPPPHQHAKARPLPTTTTTTTTSSATRLGQTGDIVSHILSFLPTRDLYSALLVSRQFFHLAAPHLYRTLIIKSGSRDISIGSTRSDDLGSGSLTHSISSSKNHLWKYVKVVHVGIHGINECPFVKHYIQPFENLDLLHLSGGERPPDLNDSPESICKPDKCQFVNKVCKNARRVILRSFDDFRVINVNPKSTSSSSSTSFGRLEKITLKIRPCQLPFYYPQHYPTSPSFSSSVMSDSMSGFEWINLPPSVKELDIVWWDERHKYRLEGYNLSAAANDKDAWFRGRGGSFGPRRMLGCTYCDQVGCVRQSPHVGFQLPAFMRVLGKQSQLDRVRVWNLDYTAEHNQWSHVKLTLEQLEDEMQRALEDGRKGRGERLHTVADMISDADTEADAGQNTDGIMGDTPTATSASALASTSTPTHLIIDGETSLHIQENEPSPVSPDVTRSFEQQSLGHRTDSRTEAGEAEAGQGETFESPSVTLHPAGEYYLQVKSNGGGNVYGSGSGNGHEEETIDLDPEEEEYWRVRLSLSPLGKDGQPGQLFSLKGRMKKIWPEGEWGRLDLWDKEEMQTYLDQYEFQ